MRRFWGLLMILFGLFCVVCFQGLGFRLMYLVGYEWALGEQNVRREPNGVVLLTNPIGMMFWCTPFLLLGVLLIAIGIRMVRRRV